MKKSTASIVIAVAALALAGCGKKDPNVPGQGKGPGTGPDGGPAVDSKTQAAFDKALEDFIAHERANDWNDGVCEDMAKKFRAASDQAKATTKADFAPALYNAGLSLQRCNKDADAKKAFSDALAADSKFHRAKVQIALYDYKAGGDAALEATIQALQQAVLDAEFQNPDALVNLAMLEMKRGGSCAEEGSVGLLPPWPAADSARLTMLAPPMLKLVPSMPMLLSPFFPSTPCHWMPNSAALSALTSTIRLST